MKLNLAMGLVGVLFLCGCNSGDSLFSRKATDSKAEVKETDRPHGEAKRESHDAEGAQVEAKGGVDLAAGGGIKDKEAASVDEPVSVGGSFLRCVQWQDNDVSGIGCDAMKADGEKMQLTAEDIGPAYLFVNGAEEPTDLQLRERKPT